MKGKVALVLRAWGQWQEVAACMQGPMEEDDAQAHTGNEAVHDEAHGQPA